jgi:hypothetical protein
MKTFLTAAVMTLVSFNSMATISKVQFKGLDQTVETQLCVAAAQGGVAAVESLAKSLNVDANQMMRSVVCNESSLRRFARQYQLPETKAIEVATKDVIFKFVPADNEAASQICATAVTKGLEAVSVNPNQYSKVYCNGVSLTRFVRQYKS